MSESVLDSSVWRQYNKDNSFREKLAEFCVMDETEFISDDKELYAVMKSKLTKKELKLFAMDSAGMSEAELCKSFSYNEEELEKAKFKLYKKLKQDKTRLSFRATAIDEE
ncbi:hypothetical protein FJR48_01955 [Sulfurimonas lithotrophica]|uniref:Uncharacterized protein n=1 Tax=Sulfurimonas lithotrophica TaxID=2590022 RepID=A0A5P8NYN9_9BACT|nr:hypothetical protein [Sulfurimonas lithotrophica]QFR48555.1 hypothetical protein FJR48_01955 [Sulfurimonas lithotrophica]